LQPGANHRAVASDYRPESSSRRAGSPHRSVRPKHLERRLFLGAAISGGPRAQPQQLRPGSRDLVKSELRHNGSDSGDHWTDTETVPIQESRLTQLIGTSVTGTDVDGRGTFVLSFSNGHVLHVIEDTEQYECYQLRIGAETIIV
jgi:hypothetical protein